MPMLFLKTICGLRPSHFRCCAAAVGGVRKNRTLTPHPMLGSRTRTCVRACQHVLAQRVTASPFTRVHARVPSSTSTKITGWEFRR